MVSTMSRNRICMQPMRQLNMRQRGLIFFRFGGDGGERGGEVGEGGRVREDEIS
jgi:hypothetical protein